MVTLRRSTRRPRNSGLSTKSANPARASSLNTIPAHPIPDPPILVTISVNPIPSQVMLPSFPITNGSEASDAFVFDGIQYSLYF